MISGISGNTQYVLEKYYEYDTTMDRFGMSKKDYEVFGDRAPTGHEKVRIISKSGNHTYWLT